MKRTAPAALCLLLSAGSLMFAGTIAFAEDEKEKVPEPIVLTLATSTEECLKTLEAIVERAEDADMLDDQVDEAEAELERMDSHCNEQRFDDALQSAKAVMALVDANK